MHKCKKHSQLFEGITDLNNSWWLRTSNVQFAEDDRQRISRSPTRAETLSPLSLWTERCYQSQFEQMAHYHTEGVLPQRKWPNIWQQHQRCQFELDSHFLWSFSLHIIEADKGDRNLTGAATSSQLKRLPWQIQMGGGGETADVLW